MIKILVLMGLMVSASAWAAKLTDPKCSELDRISVQLTPEYLAVIDGYNSAGKKNVEVDMATIVKQADDIKAQCDKNKDAAVSTVRKNISAVTPQGLPHVTTGGAIDPMKANCINFLALDERYQPLAAFWVAGHTKAGKVKSGDVDDAYLTNPIAVLIEQCKAAPMSSFFEKTKSWLKRKG